MTQDEHLRRMIAASSRVTAARSALDGIPRREPTYLMLNDFVEKPGQYEYTPEHMELKAALEHKASVDAADLAHTHNHGHEPFKNKVRKPNSSVGNVTYITPRESAMTLPATMVNP
jgi:hypothetical protein